MKPQTMALLPFLILPLLWFALPRPHFDNGPQLHDESRQVALRVLQMSRHFRTQSHMSSVESGSVSTLSTTVSTTTTTTTTTVDVPSSIGSNGVSGSVNHQPRILIVTAISPSPCRNKHAQTLIEESLRNKRAYAARHGYGFYVSRRLTDPNLKGAWNKIALLRQILHQSAETGDLEDNDDLDSGEDLFLVDVDEYEWVLWIDYDSLIVNMDFQIPFDRYAGNDLVLWGQEHELYNVGDAHMGLNTGVMLVRLRSEWSTKLFESVSELGYGDGKVYEQEMKKELGVYDWALFDQNGLAYALKHTFTTPQDRSKVLLERSYTMNGYWKDWPVEEVREHAEMLFVKHYMGCQFCSGINEQELDQCQMDFWETSVAVVR